MGRRKTWRARAGLNPARTAALSFAGMILVGTALLALPVMSRAGETPDLFTSFFTSASAVCVTGFTLVDTAGQWSFWGQLVILVLVQLGALGFMMAYSLILLLFRREIILSQRVMLASALGLRNIGGVTRLVRHGLVGTLFFELAGTILLAVRFVPEYGWGEGLWKSLFHSVSAFCNAGFELFGGSLAQFAHDPHVLMVHMMLTVIGGLGFFVWEDLLLAKNWRSLTLYSRLAISATGVLLLAGWVYFTWAEWANPGTLGAMAPADRLVGGLFQSVNLRTAGFALFDQGQMTEAAQAVSLLFMVIGGCSGSTACGIKVVTALVLAAALWAGLRGRPETVICGRTIPRDQVRNAMTLTFAVLLAAFLAAVVLTHVEGLAFLPVLFETVAAIGTVGLSTGITADLTLFSQSVLLVLMFLGRAGILALSLAFLIRRPAEPRIGYPTCDLFIG